MDTFKNYFFSKWETGKLHNKLLRLLKEEKTQGDGFCDL